MTQAHCRVCELFGTPIEPLPITSQILPELQQLVNTGTDWQFYDEWENVLPLSPELVTREPFFQWLMAREPYQAALVKLNPREMYGWHTDVRRGVAVNMLVEHSDSVTLFGNSVHGEMKRIHPHRYEIGRYYVFNTQVPHSVINFGDQRRVLFTVQFERQVGELSFNDLMADIRANYTF